jgi:hypothetical protein
MGTEKQEKHMVNITFLFTSEGHKAIWEPWILFFWISGFLTQPGTNSHKQGPTTGSDSQVLPLCISFLDIQYYVFLEDGKLLGIRALIDFLPMISVFLQFFPHPTYCPFSFIIHSVHLCCVNMITQGQIRTVFIGIYSYVVFEFNILLIYNKLLVF